MCTDTAGYCALRTPIQDIIDLRLGNVRKVSAAGMGGANSDIIFYDDVEWVAYINSETKAYRQKVYDTFHFAGTSDWSLDLQQFLLVAG